MMNISDLKIKGPMFESLWYLIVLKRVLLKRNIPSKWKYVLENIYEDPAEIPLGSARNYPDIKTTVL